MVHISRLAEGIGTDLWQCRIGRKRTILAAKQPTDLAALSALIARRSARSALPFTVAIDGRSGAGKSTLAASLAEELGAVLVQGGDFYAGGTSLRDDPPASLARGCIDWTRQRAVLLSLRGGNPASWRAFDWGAFDGRLRDDPTTREPMLTIILEGVYSARPELADLIDLSVLVTVDEQIREARLLAREGDLGPWERQWHQAENHYFSHIRPERQFDVQFTASDRPITDARADTSGR
ncbi:MAG: (d)CMP kinase [Paracoccus sp. (in: a-proteobacteria)]|nr:(d)CMP kinase [Paracoccus sp. (in: a-proteobacteria)]